MLTLALAGAALDGALVASWHAPAGDGTQYYKLSQSLLRDGRYAFGPNAALDYTRMPGYPLFLAYVVEHKAPLSLADHVWRACLANIPIALASALLVFLILRERGLGDRVALIGLIAALTCPLLLLLSCYALTETLAIFLTLAMLYCALRAGRGSIYRWSALCGLFAGMAALVRVDSVTVVPAVVMAILWSKDLLKRRLGALGLAALVAAVVFEPWPLRNQRQFGHPYPTAWYWRTMSGRPLPPGPIAWARTWATNAPGMAFLDLSFAFELPLDPARPGVMYPQMYDSPEERAQVVALFQRYNRERLTPAISDAFAALARARARRAPVRTFIELPLERMARMWLPLPEYELPMRVSWLKLPRARPAFGVWDFACYALALGGAALLLLRGGEDRRTVWLFGSCIVARCVLFGWMVPLGSNQRYLVEIFPELIMFAAVAVAALIATIERRRSAGELPAGERAVDELEPILPPK